VLTLAGLEILGKILKSSVIACLWENPRFMGNAASLVVRGNNSLTINIALSETVTHFSAIV
jgi:hypothetical protein